jgi:redox-sensitive bicupin YhaK (pirin superfamily)
MIQRTLGKVTQNSWHQGFLGTGHRALAVLDGVPYQESDPFIVFMDDNLNHHGGESVGGAHPHAGFETLTLILEGNSKEWETGSFELMTAGKGIIHTEEITSKQKFRILQVWLALPPDKRWIQPSWQKISLADVPTSKTDQYEIRVYSGRSNGLISPIVNHTPLTVVDFRMTPHQTVAQEIPSSYGGLVYVLEGSVQAGNQTVEAGQAGWLDKVSGEKAESQILFNSLSDQTHFVLYAAQPHHASIASHGPFIGDTTQDIVRLYNEYRSGLMPHLASLPDDQKKVHRT